MQLKATQCCWTCSNRFNLRYYEPLSAHGQEHGWFACPDHYAAAYKKQALEDMGHGPAYDAYCAAMRPTPTQETNPVKGTKW